MTRPHLLMPPRLLLLRCLTIREREHCAALISNTCFMSGSASFSYELFSTVPTLVYCTVHCIVQHTLKSP